MGAGRIRCTSCCPTAIQRALSISVILSNKLVKPTEDLIMPLETIPMIQNPVVLIRENHQATRNASPTPPAILSANVEYVGVREERTVVKPGRQRSPRSPGDGSPCFRE